MSQEIKELKGITWDHSRGLVPLVATAQRFNEQHPGIHIRWSTRSLQEFADKPLSSLVHDYDLLIIDHPWIGFAAETNILVPLDEYLSADFLEDQARNSVGHSFNSYTADGHQWALAVDAAAPVASSRPDILKKEGLELPETFDDVLRLAEEGWIAFPAIPIDSLMNFYMFCSAFGENPFLTTDRVIEVEAGVKALKMLRKLAKRIDSKCFDWNPIRLYEAMSHRDDIAYCPFAYGYVNYARTGYATNCLHFHDLVSFKNNGKLTSTLGGTGLAISQRCNQREVACKYLEYVASAERQQKLYFESGGQPGHREAWLNDDVNKISNDFFKATFPALERAFLRPGYNGYLHFQDNAGLLIQEYMKGGGDEKNIHEKLNQLYKTSLA